MSSAVDLSAVFPPVPERYLHRQTCHTRTPICGPNTPRHLIVVGFDQFGQLRSEIVDWPAPSLYFWLGRDAYPEWPKITRVIS